MDISSGDKFGESVKLQKTLRIYQLRRQVWRKREASENSEDISSGSKFGGSVKLQKTLRISAQAPSLVQQFEYDYHAWYILYTRVINK